MSSVDTSPQQLDEVPAKLFVPDAESKVDGPASDRPMFEHITKTRNDDVQAAVITKIDLMIIPLVGIICMLKIYVCIISTNGPSSDFVSFLVS